MHSMTNMLSLDETAKEIERLLALYGSLTRPDVIMHISADSKTVVEALDKLTSAKKISLRSATSFFHPKRQPVSLPTATPIVSALLIRMALGFSRI